MDEKNFAVVPEHLRRRTIETMPIETPYYISVEPEDDEDGKLWVDARSGQLRTYTDIALDEGDREAAKGLLNSSVPIMRVEFFDEQLVVRRGLVADLRYIDEGIQNIYDDEEPPDDREHFQEWMDNRKKTVNFVAIATLDSPEDSDNEQVSLSGDPVFFDGLTYLMSKVDELADDTPSERASEGKSGAANKGVRKLLGRFARRNG
jgi:hypothetical protein